MDTKGQANCFVVILTVALTSCYGAASFASKEPALFLTIKSSNFGMAKFDHIKCGFLVVTDILISPDGVPLPFCNDNCVYNKKTELKVIASFGGAVVPSDLFVFLSCDDNRRTAFVNNLVAFAIAYGFDGIDLAWLYPALQEREQYVRLLQELRHACDRNDLLLTVTVPSRPSVIEVNYPVKKLEKYADFVVLSTTEFRKLRKTSFIAPLYSNSPGSSNSIDYHVNRWKLAGLSSGKIVIVIQTMTLTYKLYIQNEYRIGTPALQLKIRPYYKICRKLYSGSLEIWDSNAKSPYAFRDLSWFSYENEKSVKEKVGFVIQQRLAGIAVFNYDEDDPINICGDGHYPLTAIVISAMHSEYLPPSVISDSQIYHVDSLSMSSPLSHARGSSYNAATSHRKSYDFHVEESDDGYGQLKTVFTADAYKSSQDPSDINGKILTEAMGDGSAATNLASLDMMFRNNVNDKLMASDEGLDYDDNFEWYLFPSENVEKSETISSSIVPSARDTGSFPTLTMNNIQLFSENSPSDKSQKTCLFSDQPDTHRVIYTEHARHAAPTPSSSIPLSAHQKLSCIHKLPGIRIFATAHGPTSTSTTTPAPIQFYTMAPATYRPPSCCQTCNSCVKMIATSGGVQPSLSTSVAGTSSAAQLYSEQGNSYSVPAIQQQTNPCSAPASMAVRFKANAQQISSALSNVCPCDGILQDPLDKRSYYLCKRGLPMCEENKFTCAQGYIFEQGSKKCVVEHL